MRIIVCLDDRNGMAFNRRRQSRDSRLTEDLVRMIGDEPLRVTPYSRGLFTDTPAVTEVYENPCDGAEEHAWCFLEEFDPTPYLCRTDRLVIYRWNRHYPSDVRFDFESESAGFRLVDRVEFEGTSHEKITKETYEK